MNGLIPLFAATVSFIITALLGLWFIPFMRRLKYGQTILEIGPKWHADTKSGIPTMGGVMFVIGIVVSIVFTYGLSALVGNSGLTLEATHAYLITRVAAGVALALGMGLIGFIDDYIKVIKKRNLGLTARQKSMLQLLVAAGYLWTMLSGGMTTTTLPFVGDIDITKGPGLIFWPIALIMIYGFTNALNLTDGVDGLATSVTLVVAAFYLVTTAVLHQYGLNVEAAALAGGCIGFLVWNIHPAKVFMGDTGSLFLGGLVVALAFGTNRPVLLIFAGILYLLEALSVVIQVSYYKRTKKRLFKMSPIHHHFELCGWSEGKIVLVFSFVAFCGCIVALLPIIFQW